MVGIKLRAGGCGPARLIAFLLWAVLTVQPCSACPWNGDALQNPQGTEPAVQMQPVADLVFAGEGVSFRSVLDTGGVLLIAAGISVLIYAAADRRG